ncbi:T9SS type A sorting domain-containing protein, partial [Rhodocytophaga aerolata]
TLSGLLGGTQYEIQARAFNAGGGTLGSSSILVNIAENPFVIAINGQSIDENSLIYLNQFQYTLTSQTIGGTVNYRWEFSKTNTFDSFVTFNTGNNTVLTLHAGQLESGERYYVRIASVKSNGAENVIKPVRSFYNALHPTVMYRPVGDITTTSTGLVSFHAQNATEAIYQIATDPSFDPATIVNIPGPARESALDPANPVSGQVVYIGRRCRVGINGRFVDITDPDNYLSSGPQWIYDYIAGLIPEQQYYIRMKLARRDANGNYLQTGYWYNVQTIRATGIPPRSNVVTYIQGGPTNVPITSPEIYVKDDPNYVETRYLLQISEDAGFSTFVYNTLEQTPKPYLVNIFRDLPTLKYNTVYYVRSGAYTINDPAGPNEPRWQNTFFKTVAAPARIAFEDEAQGAETHSRITVAPNPFSQSTKLTIAPNHNEVLVRITDMMGRTVEEINSSGGKSIMLGSQWKSGLYVIQVIDPAGEHETKTVKVLKQ